MSFVDYLPACLHGPPLIYPPAVCRHPFACHCTALPWSLTAAQTVDCRREFCFFRLRCASWLRRRVHQKIFERYVLIQVVYIELELGLGLGLGPGFVETAVDPTWFGLVIHFSLGLDEDMIPAVIQPPCRSNVSLKLL
jgi:hypothetical protein